MSATAPRHQVRETRTLRFARFVVGHRGAFAAALIGLTLFFAYPILNTLLAALDLKAPQHPRLRIDSSARALFPDHPYVHAHDAFAHRFGSASLVAVAVVVKEGTLLTPEHLATLQEVTRRLDGLGFDTRADEREALGRQLEARGVPAGEIRRRLDRRHPPYPVDHHQLSSLAHPSSRVIRIESDGTLNQQLLMPELPETPEQVEALRQRLLRAPPHALGRLLSGDEKAALVSAGFVTDRLSSREVYRALFDHVQGIARDLEAPACRRAGGGLGGRLGRALGLSRAPDPWPDGCPLRIFVAGPPIQVGWVLGYAGEILAIVVLTVGVVFVLLWLYFRRWHGVLIPMLAALTTVLWGLGFTGWTGMTFDPLILVIPMIITARAVSHTVQMAERFFEDYERLLPRFGDPERAKRESAARAMGELVVPGTLGIVTDVAGLLVIMVTTIPQMQDLAILGAFWVLAILATVELLHPILICSLPAPASHEHRVPSLVARFTHAVGNGATHPVGKYLIAGTALALFLGSGAVTLLHSKIGDATPGTPLLWPDHELNVASAEIARRFGGVDSLVVYADGDRPNAAADPGPIRAMEGLERSLAAHTELGASVSLVPFLRSYWRIQHHGDPKWSFVPESPGVVRAALFQLQQNGPPGFLRPYMSDDGRDANIAFFYPDHRGETVTRVTQVAERFIQANPLGEVSIRLDRDRAAEGAPLLSAQRLADLAYYSFGPLASGIAGPRQHTLRVRLRQEDGSYRELEPKPASAGLPPWIRDFRRRALADYAAQRASAEPGAHFPWPDTLADWRSEDVDAWWESEAHGIRAVAVNTRDLIVADRRAVDPTPRYQPTGAWTRGVQLVMAGGSLGITAAVNQEVERSHVANISLIFLVIFFLHSLTYRSLSSGAIIFLQVSTATLVSLAYMALRGVGLNIHTLPVQAVGVGIGVDYAIYIVDRIRQEVAATGDIDEAVRRAVRTTGMAVTFTATTVAGGIFLWMFSDLRFQAEMAQLLVFLMLLNMLGAISVVPAFYSILRPKVATALLSREQRNRGRGRQGDEASPRDADA